MSKISLSLLVVLLMFQFGALPVSALEIVISDQGIVSFYHDQVLGDEDDIENSAEKENEKVEQPEHRQERKTSENRERREIRNDEKTVSKPAEIRESKPFRSINSNQTQLKIEGRTIKPQVILEQKKKSPENKPEFDNKEETTVDRLKIEAPARLKTPSSEDEVAMNRENELENEVEVENEFEDRDEQNSNPGFETNRFSPIKSKVEIRNERRNRNQEKVEIKSKIENDGTTRFEFKSRNVEAKSNGADFILDPETNEIKLVTPSGQEHLLVHLPDQAALQMEAAGFVDSAAIASGEVQLEMETKDDGTVVYKTQVERPKKFLGLFPRAKISQIELNDETGEVIETPQTSDSLVGQFMDLITF